MKLEINITNGSLRETLINEGFAFPCGGKGICGRCKIIAPTLQITALDKRFISAEDLVSGVRLACDKKHQGSLSIDTLDLKKSAPPKKLFSPEVVAGLYDTHTVISILEEGEVVETEVFASANLTTNDLRGVVGKNSIEFYEKYGVAKAITIMPIGTKARIDLFTKATDCLRYTSGDTVDASVYDMPAEDVYLPPLTEMAGGSIALMELNSVPTDSLMISLTNDDITVAYNGEHIIASSLGNSKCLTQDIKEGVLSADVASVMATVAFFSNVKGCNNVVIYSNTLTADEVNAVFATSSATKDINVVVESSKAMDTAIAVLNSNRLKAKLNKIASRVSYINLPEDNIWQNMLVEVLQ